jgi:small subunit ribosomal protein S16
MLTIRLQRTGTKNKPSFRIVLAEAHRAAGKKSLEVLGHYNPKSKELGIKDKERLTQLITNHTSVSPTVYNLLIEKQIITGKKVKAWQPKKKVGEVQAATPAPTSEAVGAPTESVGVESQV